MGMVDYFLKIATVEGESADAKHKGEIEVESFSWGETATAGADPSTGSSTGRVQAQDFHFVKKVDKSSPALMIGCAANQHFKSAILTARKAGRDPLEFLKITLEDVSISSYNVSGNSASDSFPLDQVSLNFARLEMSYREQKADGSVGAEVKQKYDFVASKKL